MMGIIAGTGFYDLGSEATLARETGIKYAAISLVDNYAHGIGDAPLDYTKRS
jgi:purine nucleoside phosphorylase